MLAHAALAVILSVRVYDTYGLQPETLASARATAARILAASDVAVSWVLCPCHDAVDPAAALIRIASAPRTLADASLGFSYVDVQQRRGTLATVFADRVRALAEVSRADQGELLGRAVAHELVHLLLGTREHARTGLMRARWTSRELTTRSPADWVLSKDDGVRVHHAALRRLQPLPQPSATVARDSRDGEPVSAP